MPMRRVARDEPPDDQADREGEHDVDQHEILGVGGASHYGVALGRISNSSGGRTVVIDQLKDLWSALQSYASAT